MILRCWSIFLCLTLLQTSKAQVLIDGQGYQNVLISFAPNVPSENGKDIVQSIQDLLESTSSVLHTAIGIRIASATFLLPPSWSTDTWENLTVIPASPEQTDRRPDINVDATELNPFGKQPLTLQYGGCGVPGHQITLPLDFLSSTEEYPRGKLLAREWLKYRYGVFDENGFSGDSLYPDYYRIPGSSEIRITECTNEEVKYIFKKPGVDEVCDMESGDNFGYCKTHPDGESAANVTSSLMYLHKGLPNMEHVCGKDNHTHHSTSRNKQNALCNGRSIWDVVKQSKDFEATQYQSDDPVPETIQFSYVQESKPGFVVLLENSDNLLEKEIPSAILFALKRFYYDLPAKSKLAIYTYSSDVTEALAYKELPAQDRGDLGSIGDFGSPPTSICTSCGLEKALEVLLPDIEVKKASIFLITASDLDKEPELPETLKESGICLHVLRFLKEDESVGQNYENLGSKFHCHSAESLQINSDVVDIFHALSHFLKNPVPEFNENFETKTVASGSISAQIPVTIPPDATAEFYTLWLGKVLGSNSIECKAGETAVTLKPGLTATDIASFTFEPTHEEVTCKLVSAKQPAALTQVQLTTQKGHYFIFDTWNHDESTDKEQLPIIIYAKIYYGGYPVKDANVTTVVTLGETQESVKMLDNGRGDPDVTQYDGIYSGYFTGFLEMGNYQITVKINDNGGKAKIGKENPPSRSATCCGSKVVSDQEEGVPAFEMEKQVVFEAKSKRPEDGYPPSRILDLQVQMANNYNEVTLTWTAPGGGKASSYEYYAFCDLEDCKDKLPKWLKLNETEPEPKSYGESEEVVFLFTEEVPTIENLPLFFAIKSVGEKGKVSDLSNKAEISLSFLPQPSTTTPAPITIEDRKLAGSDTTGIIVGSTVIGVLLLLCLGAVLYLFVIKPRRSAKPSDIEVSDHQDKNQNGTEVSGSFRAIHARNRNSSSMRRVESFPVLLYTHDQLKDFKKKVDAPLYKPNIAPRPWMSMNVLSNSELRKSGDSKSIGSASTLPMNDKHRSGEMKQLDDISLTSETPHPEEPIKL